MVGRHAAPTTLHGAARALTDARRVLPWQAMKPSGPVPARMPVTAGLAPSLRRRRRRRRGPSRLRRNGPRARRTRATSGDGGRSSSGPRAATTTAPSSSATRSSCTARPVSRASTQPTATPRACKCCTTTLRPSRRAWTATSARSTRRPSCVGNTVRLSHSRPLTLQKLHSTHPWRECSSPPRPSGEWLPWAEGLQAVSSN